MIIFLILTLLFATPTYASSSYTQAEVATHNTQDDCWMIFENEVYDLTNYITQHDRYMDITNWCGEDMTEDFKTKAERGIDHKTSTYSLLENYKIGTITEEVQEESQQETSIIEEEGEEQQQQQEENVNPYNFLLPILIALLTYYTSYIFLRKNNIRRFNAFWNTILLIVFLIPTFGFGLLMIIRYTVPELYNLNFNFLYWHVELSLFMGTLGIIHFIQRIPIYIKQILPNK